MKANREKLHLYWLFLTFLAPGRPVLRFGIWALSAYNKGVSGAAPQETSFGWAAGADCLKDSYDRF